MRRFIPEGARLLPAEAERKFRGEIFDVYQWPQEMFDGSRATFEMLKAPDTVEVIAVKGDKIVITRQKQPRTDWFYAYPGGRCDHPEEDELMAAQRELREETGLECANWKLIDAKQPHTKIDRMIYLFLATDVVARHAQQLDPGEMIEVQEVSFAELEQIAQRKDARYLWPPAKSLAELLAKPALFEY